MHLQRREWGLLTRRDRPASLAQAGLPQDTRFSREMGVITPITWGPGFVDSAGTIMYAVVTQLGANSALLRGPKRTLLDLTT